MLTIAPHPLLDVQAFETAFPLPLGEMASPAELVSLLAVAPPAEASPAGGDRPPLASDDGVREAVRAMLRHGGFKAAGRSKPASEYLLRAVADGTLGSINLAVDACNVVSLHSGLPISVVDLDQARPPFRVEIAAPGASYVFNASGQSIDLAGLVCLFDADGPCGNAVKDAQRTKTSAATTRTLSIVWGTQALPGRAAEARRWYRELLEKCGATTTEVWDAS